MPRVARHRWTLSLRLTVGAMLGVHAVLAWLMRAPGLATGHDDALNIVLARALRGGSYDELQIVGHPAHAMYPPLYPTLLGALGVTAPADVWIGVLANTALSIAMLALVAGVALRVSPWLAVAVTLACAVNPMLLYVASGVHSEPLLAATAALAISVAATKRRDARALALIGLMAIAAALARSIGLALVVSTFALLAFEKRWRALTVYTVAAALTVGSWLAWTVRAPRLEAGRSYVADALYVAHDSATAAEPPSVAVAESPPTIARRDSTSLDAATRDAATRVATARNSMTRDTITREISADSAELDERRAAAAREEEAAERVASARAGAALRFARNLTGRAFRNVPAYLTRELPTVLAIPTRAGTPVDNVLWLLVLVVTAGAGIVVLLRRAWLLVAYVALSSAILALWPYVDKRFLAPLIPLVILAMLGGTWWVADRTLGLRAARFAALAVAVLLAAFAIDDDVERLARIASCDRTSASTSPACFNDEQRAFFAAAAAARELTPDSARFLVSKEATFYLLSDRQAVRESDALAQRTPDALRAFLATNGVGYILLSHLHLDQWALASTLLPQCGTLQLMATFGEHVALLRIPPIAAESVAALPGVASPDTAAPAVAVPNDEPPRTGTPADSVSRPAEAVAGTATSTSTRDGCEAIARWNVGSWDPPPVRIW